MTSKTPANDDGQVRVRKDLKPYTYLGCPLTKNQTPWCFRICKPTDAGTGFCGRLAPHSFKGRIQQGIDDFKEKEARDKEA